MRLPPYAGQRQGRCVQPAHQYILGVRRSLAPPGRTDGAVRGACVAGRGRGRGGLPRGVQAADGAGAAQGEPAVHARRVELVAAR